MCWELHNTEYCAFLLAMLCVYVYVVEKVCSVILFLSGSHKMHTHTHMYTQPSCQMERRTSDKGFTALHIAISEGYTAMVELLVGYGADVNSTVENGDTALMMVLSQKKMKPLNSDTPHLKQVCKINSHCYMSIDF